MRLLPVFLLPLLFSCKLLKKKDEEKKPPITTVMQVQFKPLSWTHHTNIYEVNLRQYTKEGTFRAFMQSLDRLKGMGVETLWFMPITPIAQKNKKGTLGSYYATSDYTGINPEFGTLEDFKLLVKTAHEKGMKVIIDWVANHTGWDNVWTTSHPEYFLKDSATHDFKIASGMDDIIELDYSNPALRKAMIDAMSYWVKNCDIDGFRCDLASWVELDFWKEARTAVDAIKPLFWLGEFDELETPSYGEAFDASYTWTWMHKSKEFYQENKPLDSLVSILKRYDDLGDSSMRAWFTTNHDENSWNGTEYEKYGEMAQALAVFSATWNGIPLVYSGQELPNEKRLEFFEKDVIAWKNEMKLEGFYKALLTLHHDHPALAAGDPTVQTIRIQNDQPSKVFSYLRKKDDKEVLVVLNLSSDDGLEVKLQGGRINGNYRNAFSGLNEALSASSTFQLKKWGWLLFAR